MNLFKYILVSLSLAWLQPCVAEDMTAERIKSAYVLNFAKFVEWPAGTAQVDNRMTLCVVGNNVLGGMLDELDGRKISGRTLHVVRRGSVGSDWNSCQILFIGESEQRSVDALIKSLGIASVLTISDIDGFAEKGGCIGLLFRNNKIVFEVNLATAQKSSLHISSQLLNLATRVFGR